MVNAPLDSESVYPTIVESYREFEPPGNFRQTVETLLHYVPQKYLNGLKTIVLTNRGGLSSKERKHKVWSRNRKVRLAECLGSYSRASKSSPAAVWLYVDNIVEAGISWWSWIPVLRYAVTGEVLYHEIGHHIHAAHHPVHEGKENVAEDWSSRLSKNFYRKHYWYMYPLLRVFARLVLPIFKKARKLAG